ncbi:hypothetical protein AAVH_17377 [Aphelenchoides avenae]|nr:hypothetical protein AAVH_17377 [Aphelenchus avenae]
MNKLLALGLTCLIANVFAEDNSVESVSAENAGTTIRPRRHSGYGSENGGRFGNGRSGQGNGFAEGRFGSGNSFGRGLFGGSERGFGENDKNDQYGGRGFGGNNFGGARHGNFGNEGVGGRGSGTQFGGNQGWIPAGSNRGFGERL